MEQSLVWHKGGRTESIPKYFWYDYLLWLFSVSLHDFSRITNLLSISPSLYYRRYNLISSPMLLGPEDSRFSNSNADILLSKYKAHNAAVKALVPKEKLLIYRIGDGWEPLCKFLDKPIPGMVSSLNFSRWKTAQNRSCLITYYY